MIPTNHLTVRHAAEAQLLHSALAGDTGAANKVIQYLSSSNVHLRRIMQESMHDLSSEILWKNLLHCLALQSWIIAAGPPQEVRLPDCDRRSDPLASERIDQAIRQVFVQDESENEAELKNELLCGALQRPETEMRYAAAYLLALRGDPSSIPALEEAIQSASQMWKLRAVQALSELKDVHSGPPLIAALAQADKQVHVEARRALLKLGPLAVPAWLEALEHPDSHVRWHAARGLGEIGDARSVMLLAEGLRDDNQAVRWATARVLARLDLKAVPAILTLLSRHKINEPFRQAAYHALNSMVSAETRRRIHPLLEALRSPAASVEAPNVAQRLLAGW